MCTPHINSYLKAGHIILMHSSVWKPLAQLCRNPWFPQERVHLWILHTSIRPWFPVMFQRWTFRSLNKMDTSNSVLNRYISKCPYYQLFFVSTSSLLAELTGLGLTIIGFNFNIYPLLLPFFATGHTQFWVQTVWPFSVINTDLLEMNWCQITGYADYHCFPADFVFLSFHFRKKIVQWL